MRGEDGSPCPTAGRLRVGELLSVTGEPALLTCGGTRRGNGHPDHSRYRAWL